MVSIGFITMTTLPSSVWMDKLHIIAVTMFFFLFEAIVNRGKGNLGMCIPYLFRPHPVNHFCVCIRCCNDCTSSLKSLMSDLI